MHVKQIPLKFDTKGSQVITNGFSSIQKCAYRSKAGAIFSDMHYTF